jgi:uncharacterized protein YjbI with pentapeptide repeats
MHVAFPCKHVLETKLTQSEDPPVEGFFLEDFPGLSESPIFESEQPVGLLDGVNLTDANLESIDLSRDSLRGATLRGANLRSTNLRGANLRGANLSAPNLGTDVGLAYITRNLLAVLAANISGGPNPIISSFGGADLRGANLRGADLRDTVLRGTIADGADLTKVILRGADLRDAALGSIKWLGQLTLPTSLHDADLSGANLRDTEVTSEQLNALKFLKGATMPLGQQYEDWLKGKKAAASI